jgi:hypothetical protein
MKTNLKSLREAFSHNKPIYKNLYQFSKLYFYLSDMGESLRGIFPEFSVA